MSDSIVVLYKGTEKCPAHGVACGCAYGGPSCEVCPPPRCVYDSPKRPAIHALRNMKIRQRRAEGVTGTVLTRQDTTNGEVAKLKLWQNRIIGGGIAVMLLAGSYTVLERVL